MKNHRIAAVAFDDAGMLLTLADGRLLRVSIRWLPRVQEATPEQQAAWTLTDDGHGLNWPQLGMDSAEGAVNVWNLEEDALYEQALARLKAVDWDVSKLSAVDHDLVALWRLEADMYNGGFLQFFCNWGEENCRSAIAALTRIGATGTRDLVQAMADVVLPYGETEAVIALWDLPALLTEADRERLDTLVNAFDTQAETERLARRVVQRYGA